MDIKAKDFPLYRLLLKNKQNGYENAATGFSLAESGGDEELYTFVRGLYEIAAYAPISQIAGCNVRIMNRTLVSCLKVFEDVASRGHKGAACLADEIKGISPRLK